MSRSKQSDRFGPYKQICAKSINVRQVVLARAFITLFVVGLLVGVGVGYLVFS